MENKLKIFFGILVIFGLYIIFRNQIETYSPLGGSTPWTTGYYYNPYSKKTLVRITSYYPSFENEYQDFMRSRVLEDYELGVYETYD